MGNIVYKTIKSENNEGTKRALIYSLLKNNLLQIT